ncbi:AI-2E family transporter [Rossellomorea vietnamensis]|uniref:AI-2E family transporter n=1 Tax=Rossellomorea vietnamensis TaxID=218284 RepID=A0A5D4MHL0_9BACI|nr:AI-2E family transporter [Rossellomorea vietnamensis]TYS01132.1 AI-2E family transporter [Rossellomorea vietnamensis]
MSKKSLQFWLIQILLIVTIVFVSTKISFLFEPITIFFTTLFFPILITLFLYFLLNPIVKILQRYKVPRIVAILIIYLLIVGLLVLAIGNLVPTISRQFTALANELPSYATQAFQYFENLSRSPELRTFMNEQAELLDTAQQKLVDFANNLPTVITGSFQNLLGLVANIAIILVTVPLLLFYMFKDGHRFPVAVSKFLPEEYRKEALTILKETGSTLAAYIQGQVTVGLFVGVLSFIGYLIIDLRFALVLAITVSVTNIIPYVGPLIGGAPAVIVGLFDSPGKALLVLLILVIAQQVEGNILSPLILGKTLDTHPATIVILLLAAGNIAGVLGMILAVPTYAVSKTIVINLVKFLKARKEAKLRAEPGIET